MLTSRINRFRLSNIVAGHVVKHLGPTSNIDVICDEAENLLKKHFFDDFEAQTDPSIFPLAGVDYESLKIIDKKPFVLSCKNRMLWAEQVAHQNLTLAIAIERFASKRDPVADAEVRTLKEKGLEIIQDLGQTVIDRKVMVQSTQRITGEIKYALDSNDGHEDVFLNTAVRTNPVGDVVIVYYPSSCEDLVLSCIHRASGISMKKLEECTRNCDLGVLGYMFEEDYQYSNPKNIIRERHLAQA